MREFNQLHVIKEIELNYHRIFPERRFKSTILSYGFRNDKTGNMTNMFFCFDQDHESIGFAVHYGSKKILRFYNQEGADAGLETEMVFKPTKPPEIKGFFNATNMPTIKNAYKSKKTKKKG